MSDHEGDRPTCKYRQDMIDMIEHFLQKCEVSTTKTGSDLENELYRKAKSEQEYSDFVWSLILYVQAKHCNPAVGSILDSADNLGDNMNERINARHNEERLQKQRNHRENLNERNAGGPNNETNLGKPVAINEMIVNQEPESEEKVEGPYRDASGNDMNAHMNTRYKKVISQEQRNVEENLDEQSAGGPNDEINAGTLVVNGTIIKKELDIEEETELPYQDPLEVHTKSQKRRSSENETSMEHGVKISRVGLQNQASGSHDIRKVAIIHEIQEKDISQKDACLLQERIIGIIDDIPEGDFIPRFYETFYEQGALRIDCADEETEIWLREKIPNLPNWQGTKLKVVKANELPKYVRFMAIFPAPAPVDTKLILKRLEKQNLGFSTKKWKIRRRIEGDQNQEIRLVFDVDEETVPLLENLGMKPFFGIGRATFNLLDIEEEEH